MLNSDPFLHYLVLTAYCLATDDFTYISTRSTLTPHGSVASSKHACRNSSPGPRVTSSISPIRVLFSHKMTRMAACENEHQRGLILLEENTNTRLIHPLNSSYKTNN